MTKKSNVKGHWQETYYLISSFLSSFINNILLSVNLSKTQYLGKVGIRYACSKSGDIFMTLGNYLMPSFVRSMSTHHEFIDKVPYYIKYIILT